MKNIEVIVKSKQTYLFLFGVHVSESPSSLAIEEDYYEKNFPSHKIPQGVHYEFGIISPDLPNHFWKRKVLMQKSKKNDRWYVKWNTRIPTLESAENILKMWCTGTVYTMETGIPFEKILLAEEVKTPIMALQTFIKNGIYVEEYTTA